MLGFGCPVKRSSKGIRDVMGEERVSSTRTPSLTDVDIRWMSVCDASHPAVGVLSSTHALEDGLVEPQLQAGLVEHLPLVAVPGDQTVYLDRLRLADTMAPSLGLEEEAFGHSETLFSS